MKEESAISIEIKQAENIEAVQSGATANKEFWAEKLSYWLFLALGFFMPVLFLPFGFSSALNKAYFAYFFLLFSFIFWLISKIKRGKLEFSKNWIFASVGLAVLIFFISGVLSFNAGLTLFGSGGETGTWLAIVFFALTVFLSSEILRKDEKILKWILFVFASSVLVFIFQVFQTGFGITLYPWNNFFAAPNFNLIGSWNNLGIFFGFVVFLALYLYEISWFTSLKYIFLFIFIVSGIALFFINFGLLWWLLGVLIIIFGTYLFFLRKGENAINPLMVLSLIIVLFFIVTPNLASNLSSLVSGVNNIEVRPSYGATIDVLKQSIKANPVLGMGPNTFLESWLKYKPFSINNTIFWNTRFENGASFLLSLAVSAGGAGLLAVLFLIGSYLYSGFIFLRSIERNKDYLMPLAYFLVSLYFFVLMALYSPNFTNLIFGFVFLGIFIGSLTNRGIFQKYEINLFQANWIGFVSSLALIFLLILSLSGVYFLAQKYVSAIYFADGLKIFNAEGNLNRAKIKIVKAASFDKQPQYYRSLAQINLIELDKLLQRNDLTPEQFRQVLQAILSETIQNATIARSLNPNDSLNWLLLGQVYERVVPIKIGQAAELARKTYQDAADIFPSSPEIPLSLARLELQLGNLDKARNYLDQAISLKPNYASAHFLYAQLESKSGNIKQAILRAETTALISPNDIGSLFQLGFLYYQDGQLNNAKSVFERLKALAPNYSNGRYFLGLIYAKEGRIKSAIQEFEDVQALNPENQEVRQILSNLKAGREALSGISSPLERKEPPVEEE